jgi:hypothetical protein
MNWMTRRAYGKLHVDWKIPRLSDHSDKANNTIAEANEHFFNLISVCVDDLLERGDSSLPMEGFE